MQHSTLKISKFGLGCWAMGGKSWSNGYSSGWSGIDEREITEAVLFAIDNGVNHFDNADCYGNGASEKLLGKILGAQTNNVIVASKVGHLKNDFVHAYVAKNIRQQCEKSLKNLNRDYLDIYYFHHGDFGENDCYLDEAIETMLRLKAEGKILELGLSAYSTQDFTRLVPKIKPAIIQSWAHLMDDKFIREKSVVRQLIEKYELAFIAFHPLNQGLLTGKYSASNPPVFEDGDHRKGQQKFTKEALEILEPKLKKIQEKFGDLTTVAVQYLLANPRVSSIIPGFRNKKQVEMNLRAFNAKPLTEEEIQFCREMFK